MPRQDSLWTEAAAGFAAGQAQATADKAAAKRTDSAARRTAARWQPDIRLRDRRGGGHGRFTRRVKHRDGNRDDRRHGLIDTIAEKGDGAGMAGIARFMVQGAVQIRTGGKHAQQPHHGRTKDRHHP